MKRMKGALFSRELRALNTANTPEAVAKCAEHIRYLQETLEREWKEMDKRLIALEQEGKNGV